MKVSQQSAVQSLSRRRNVRFLDDRELVTGELDRSRFRDADSLQGASILASGLICITEALFMLLDRS